MRYSKIREMDVSNGEGVGVALFVQGCHFHCKGCFNQETWDFNGGKEFTDETILSLVRLATKPYIRRVSILGGEPLCDENVHQVFRVVRYFDFAHPDKKTWLYTGYDVDDILRERNQSEESFERFLTIIAADVVVDGKFQIENQDIFNEKIVFAGSTNQRILRHQDILKRYNELNKEVK